MHAVGADFQIVVFRGRLPSDAPIRSDAPDIKCKPVPGFG
jgi:hypothetical protein